MADENLVGDGMHGTSDSVRSLTLAQLVESCQAIDPSWTEDFVSKAIDDFFCTDAGFVKLRPVGEVVHIDLIYVLPDHRGKGHGRDLVELAENVARSLDYIGVGLETIEPEFFAHLGYSVMGVLSGFARGRDLTVMYKEIQ